MHLNINNYAHWWEQQALPLVQDKFKEVMMQSLFMLTLVAAAN
jgi:hypothetical protein